MPKGQRVKANKGAISEIDGMTIEEASISKGASQEITDRIYRGVYSVSDSIFIRFSNHGMVVKAKDWHTKRGGGPHVIQQAITQKRLTGEPLFAQMVA